VAKNVAMSKRFTGTAHDSDSDESSDRQKEAFTSGMTGGKSYEALALSVYVLCSPSVH